jgi:hypothetical protein
MRYTKFKTKLVFTLGIYFLVWRYKVARGLRDDFGVAIDPAKELWLGFIPIYGAIRWWRFLKQLQALQQRIGMPVVVSPARAFWLSSWWFASGPYLNKHLNALYVFQAGRVVGGSTTPMASGFQPRAQGVPQPASEVSAPSTTEQEPETA